MSIRDLSVPFTIEVTGEDVEVFLKKEEISSKYFEVISMPEVEEKMEETVISLSRFAKILMCNWVFKSVIIFFHKNHRTFLFEHTFA